MDLQGLYAYEGKFCRDSRAVCPGDVYVAIQGERLDGHGFIAEAFAKGAAYALVSRIVPDAPADRQVLVADTLQALEDIARHVRATTKAKIICITGSSGKTSTKEMLRHALEGQGNIHATTGNLNNHIGLPLMLANMPADTDIAVLEIGMNHSGELAHLTRIARPDIAVVTNIGNAHHEFFKSTRDIAVAKAEIFQGLEEGGTAIINADGEFYSLLRDAVSQASRTISFGHNGDCRLLKYENGHVVAEILGEKLEYDLQLLGEHQALNSLLVLGVVRLLDLDIKKAIANISTMQGLPGRGQMAQVPCKGGSFTLLDDAYNANPDSMKAAIRVLGSFKNTRRIAVLGEMRELGEFTKELHLGLLPEVMAAGADKVFCCCGAMKYLYDALPAEKRGGWAEESAALKPLLREAIKPGDTVLVKGSLGSNMLPIVDYLKKMGEG